MIKKTRIMRCLSFGVILVVSGCVTGISPNSQKVSGYTQEVEEEGYDNLTGVVQKGPFINGSTVFVQELDADLNSTGRTHFSETYGNVGNFNISDNVQSNCLEVLTSGFFYNEIGGYLSNAPITLSSLACPGDDNTVNVNVLTTLSRERVRHLMLSNGLTFSESVNQSYEEILSIFNIYPQLEGISADFSHMDITQTGNANAVLLAISLVILGDNTEAELTEFISDIVTDLASDGTIDSSRLRNALLVNGMLLNLSDIRNNLESRYAYLGYPNTVIPNFEDYIDSDGDGILNKYEQNEQPDDPIDDQVTYKVGGTVSGLIGVLVLSNGDEELSISSNGAFTFLTDVANEGMYDVSVLTQPDGQFCSIENHEGEVNDGNVSDILVACTNSLTTLGAVALSIAPSFSQFYKIAVDVDGNIIAIGYLNGNDIFDLGNGITVQGGNDGTNAVIVKYSPTLQAVWAKSVNSNENSLFNDIAVDESGNAYAVGEIYGAVAYDFGDGKVVTPTFDGTSSVVVKYLQDGSVDWVKTPTIAPADSSFKGIAVDSSNAIVVVGTINGTETFDFGNDKTASGGYVSSNSVIVKYSSEGYTEWANTTQSTSNMSFFRSVITDDDNAIYVVGKTLGTGAYDYGSDVVIPGPADNWNGILVKYSADGIAQWAKTAITVPSGESTEYADIAVDKYGAVYVAGQIRGGEHCYLVDNEICVVPVTGVYTWGNAIILKYDGSGSAQWGYSVSSGESYSSFNSIAISKDDNVYAAGSLGSSPFNVGGDITLQGSNAFIAKYDLDGNILSAKTPISSDTNSNFIGIATDENGHIYVDGSIQTQTDFGNDIIVDALFGDGSWQNLILVKYSQ